MVYPSADGRPSFTDSNRSQAIRNPDPSPVGPKSLIPSEPYNTSPYFLIGVLISETALPTTTFHVSAEYSVAASSPISVMLGSQLRP